MYVVAHAEGEGGFGAREEGDDVIMGAGVGIVAGRT
jgi:hypothetical protein